MAMVVNHNIPALVTYNTINRTSSAIERSIQKLSTGLRINSAADDAAGLAISEKMRAQITGLDRAVSNSQDGISMIQTAEGALSETHSILQRMRELSVQAANDTLTQQDRGYIQLEIDQLREEVTRIGNTTQFNKKKLLDGSAAALWSSDTLSTKALINGGLRTVDQFGQKNATEGNFVIDINAAPGKAQVQKTDIFTIKHPDVIMDASTNAQAGINGVSVNNIPAGDYTIKLDEISKDFEIKFDASAARTSKNLADVLNLSVGKTTAGSTNLSARLLDIDTAGGTAVVGIGADPDDALITPIATLRFNLSNGSLIADPANVTALEAYGLVLNQGNTKLGSGGAVDIDALRAGLNDSKGDALTGVDGGMTVNFTVKESVAIKYTAGARTTTGTSSADASIKANFGAFDVSGIVDNDGALSAGNYAIRTASGLTGTSTGISGTFEIVDTATNAVVGTAAGVSVNTGTGGVVSFSVGGKTVGVTFAASGASNVALFAGDSGTAADPLTYSKTITVTQAAEPGAVDSGYKSSTNYVTVPEYKSKITITADSTINAENGIAVRVAGTNVANGEITVDIYTLDATGQATGVTSSVTVGAAGFTQPVILKDAAGADKTVNLRLALNDTSAAFLDRVKIGDEIALGTSKDAALVGRYGTKNEIQVNQAKAQSNASILLEVESVSKVNGSVTFKATANILNTDGSTTTRVSNITLDQNDRVINSKTGDVNNLLGLDLTLSLNGAPATDFKAGDKLVYNVVPMADWKNDDGTVKNNGEINNVKAVSVEGEQNDKWGSNWIYTTTDANGNVVVHNDVTLEGTKLQYAFNSKAVEGQDVHLKNFYVNEKDGTVYTGDIVLNLAADFDSKVSANAKLGDTLASFEAAYVGQVAKGDVILRDLDKFWNSEGRFLLKDAQTLTITQGDGANTKITLYATDTLNDVKTKLNDAIGKALGQQASLAINKVGDDPAASSFVTFVEDKKEGTSEAVEGTFVVRSIIAGDGGTISFAGDEDVIKAFSLNEIQSAFENSFTVGVWDAHSGKSVASGVKITGNKLIGVVNENVDVEFDPMANVKVQWNDATKAFALTKDEGSYQTILHLADNTTVFQIGANEGEDMGVNIGDMRSRALGLNAVLVTDRVSAARSITIIDNAIDKVSTQRAKLGAYQNRLEHTIANLNTAGENLTAAESRIRDTDMAKEMMNFSKLQIMLQAGTSMLAQANALPQNVLSLIR
ncbi:hypothetical protein AGMMS49957_01560 [Synergistales bacterium]|nr:hypothetical protein AGMMS49957_01560 [Synergistales bacterium]